MRVWSLYVRYLAAIVVVCSAMTSQAQLTQTARYEREHKPSHAGWTVISLKENGLAMVRDNEKYRDGKRIFEMILLDTTLTEKTLVELELENRAMNLTGYEYSSNRYIDILFREGDSELGEMELIEYDLNTGEHTRYHIKSQFNFKLTHFTVVDRNAVFGGYVTREPAVVIYDKAAKQTKVVPGFFTSDTELLDLRVNQNGTFNTLITNRSSSSEKTLVLRTFDKTGAQLMEDEIPIDPNKTILSALTSSLVREELLIAGTYAIGHSKSASGFFSVLADPFNEQPIYYYDFPKLGHFLEYMKPKRSEKIRSVSERQREHGKDPEFRANVSNIRLEEYPDGFFLLAEVYNASSATNTMYPYQNNPYYNGYYNPYGYNSYFSPYSSRFYNSPYNYGYGQPRSSSVRVVESAVVVFNSDGKLDWDHSLKVENDDRNALEQTSDFWSDKNRIVIANKSESELTIKVRYRNDEDITDTIPIMLKNEQEMVRDETRDEGGVRFWYGNKFYIWGYQTLKDPTLNILEDRNRTVFYLVKADAY